MAANIPVLLIDNDEQQGEILTEYLAKYDFILECCQHPESEMVTLPLTRYWVVLLDIMLSGINGLHLCKEIRRTSNIPIIILTAREELSDKVLGFEYGADDYLVKPFERRELVARMQSLLRCQEEISTPMSLTQANEFIIDKDNKQVRIADKAIELTNIELIILSMLADHPGAVFSRNKILQNVKGLKSGVCLQTRAIDNSVSRLRHKLDDDGNGQQFIRTIWGRGYSFVDQPN